MAKAPTTITVAKAELDEYGNLNVTDTLGNATRINKKHESLHPLFQQGNVVKVVWDNYKGKDFVSDAELVSGTAEAPEVKPKVETPNGKPLPYLVEMNGRARNTALMQACEMAKEGGKNWSDILPLADRFYQWLVNEVPVTASKTTSVDDASVKKAVAVTGTVGRVTDKVTLTAEEVIEDLRWIVDNKKMTGRQVNELLISYGGKGDSKTAMVESIDPVNLIKFAKKIEPLVPSRLARQAVAEGIGEITGDDLPF